MQKPVGRRRQHDVFPRGFTTMTRVVVVVVAVAVAVVVVPIRAVVHAKNPLAGAGSKICFPGALQP